MNYTLKPLAKPVNATLEIPGSKSITNRALLLGALAKGTSYLSGMLLSDDTLAFLKALTALGVEIVLDVPQKSAQITGCNGRFPNTGITIECQEAGTILRFLTAACATMPGQFHFKGAPRLAQRPIKTLLEVLVAQGAALQPPGHAEIPFTLLGTPHFSGGSWTIASNESSQFLSALLMVAPLAKTATQLKTHQLISRPYVELTCQMMASFGVSVTHADNDANEIIFNIPSPQAYEGRSYAIEPDASTASYFFAAAAITNGAVTVLNINREHCQQGDIGFLKVLEAMGCRVEASAHQITLKGSNSLKGLSIDMSDISDTFITLACIAPFAETPTTITNIAHAQLKESNRIDAVARNLQTLGIAVEQGNDFITIYPSKPNGGLITSYGDHRIAMGFSIMGLVSEGITIDNIHCVSKTCPNFLDLLEAL